MWLKPLSCQEVFGQNEMCITYCCNESQGKGSTYISKVNRLSRVHLQLNKRLNKRESILPRKVFLGLFCSILSVTLFSGSSRLSLFESDTKTIILSWLWLTHNHLLSKSLPLSWSSRFPYFVDKHTLVWHCFRNNHTLRDTLLTLTNESSHENQTALPHQRDHRCEWYRN